MPAWRNKASSQQNFLKRRTFEEGRAQLDAAHRATARLYCDALRLWRRCPRRGCKRHRGCRGEADRCLLRALAFTPPSKRRRAQQHVIAGGVRHITPTTHAEWSVRRSALAELISWRFD